MVCTTKTRTNCKRVTSAARIPQSFPKTGTLGANLNKKKAAIEELVSSIDGDGVYAYILTAVAVDSQRNCTQYGSAPNFQGGRVTLCTCKHKMRAGLNVNEWKNKWIAGFSSRKYDGHHWLFYLARVEKAYESHCELWNGLKDLVRKQKSAKRSTLGDVFEPKECMHHDTKPPCDCNCKFSLNHYFKPIDGHVHRKSWPIDIDYRRKKTLLYTPKRPASLLVCYRKLSFLWQRPVLFTTDRWRQKQWDCLSDFLNALQEKK